MEASLKEIAVSVIIPVYNVSDYIERCLQSVMLQTYDNIECILVDDASPDDSIDKCERSIAEYKGNIHFTIQHHTHNRGLSAARNTGTHTATGDWIIFLDGDDELAVDGVERLIAPVKRDNSIELVLGNWVVIDEGRSLPKMGIAAETDIKPFKAVRDFCLRRGAFPVPAWSKLISKSFLLDNQLEFKEGLMWEDNLWTFYVLKHLEHLYIIPEVVYIYYKRPNSITTRNNRNIKHKHFDFIYREIANDFTAGDEDREAKRYLFGFCMNAVDRPCPPDATVNETARLFKKVLDNGHCTKESAALSITMQSSKTALGRAFVKHALRTRLLSRFLRG